MIKLRHLKDQRPQELANLDNVAIGIIPLISRINLERAQRHWPRQETSCCPWLGIHTALCGGIKKLVLSVTDVIGLYILSGVVAAELRAFREAGALQP